jgi:hypothetical protein
MVMISLRYQYASMGGKVPVPIGEPPGSNEAAALQVGILCADMDAGT